MILFFNLLGFGRLGSKRGTGEKSRMARKRLRQLSILSIKHFYYKRTAFQWAHAHDDIIEVDLFACLAIGNGAGLNGLARLKPLFLYSVLFQFADQNTFHAFTFFICYDSIYKTHFQMHQIVFARIYLIKMLLLLLPFPFPFLFPVTKVIEARSGKTLIKTLPNQIIKNLNSIEL